MCSGWATAGSILQTRPVPEDGGPTPVFVAVGILDIDEISSAAQNFSANVFFSIRWFDPRLAHHGPGDEVHPISEVWSPSFLIVNEQRAWDSLAKSVRVSPEGEVVYVQRLWGMFSQPLDMHEFPFDTQEFSLVLASTRYHPEELAITEDPKSSSGIAPEFSLPDWEILDWELDFTPYQAFGIARTAASYGIRLHARRYTSHYVLKVILPLVLIVTMSWIVFWIDPAEIGVQIGVATTSMLTLIAYRFMVGSEVPIVPYLTRMDLFIFGSTILVYASLMQAVSTSLLARENKTGLARSMDLGCRIISRWSSSV